MQEPQLMHLASQGLLADDGRQVVSGLVYNVFSPCLFLTKLADFSIDDVVRLWPLTANMMLTHVIGAGLGLVLVKFAATPEVLRRHTVLATTVGGWHWVQGVSHGPLCTGYIPYTIWQTACFPKQGTSGTCPWY